MTRKAAKTFHLLAMAKSLEQQNDVLFNLISAIETVLEVNPGMKGRDALSKALDDCRAAMWPDGEG